MSATGTTLSRKSAMGYSLLRWKRCGLPPVGKKDSHEATYPAAKAATLQECKDARTLYYETENIRPYGEFRQSGISSARLARRVR